MVIGVKTVKALLSWKGYVETMHCHTYSHTEF